MPGLEQLFAKPWPNRSGPGGQVRPPAFRLAGARRQILGREPFSAPVLALGPEGGVAGWYPWPAARLGKAGAGGRRAAGQSSPAPRPGRYIVPSMLKDPRACVAGAAVAWAHFAVPLADRHGVPLADIPAVPAPPRHALPNTFEIQAGWQARNYPASMARAGEDCGASFAQPRHGLPARPATPAPACGRYRRGYRVMTGDRLAAGLALPCPNCSWHDPLDAMVCRIGMKCRFPQI